MEEVDKIIIHTLSSLGCNLNGDVQTISQFGVAEVVDGVVRCLCAIDSSCDLAPSLPHNMAQRFRAASAVAASVKELGYSADLGYQSLLYPNEVDLRRLLMFLIEKLPKDSTTVSDEQLGKKAQIQKQVSIKLKSALERTWVPPHCRKVAFKRRNCGKSSVTEYGTAHCHMFSTVAYPWLGIPCNSKNVNKPGCDTMRPTSIAQYCSSEMIKSSLLHAHALQLQKERISAAYLMQEDKENDINFVLEPLWPDIPSDDIATENEAIASGSTVSRTQAINDLNVPKETSEELETRIKESLKSKEEAKHKEREDEIKCAINDIQELTLSMKHMTLNINDTKQALGELCEDIKNEELKQEDFKKDLKTKQRISSFIPEADTNVQRLQSALKNSQEKMQKLQKQWEDHSIPLEQQLQNLTHKTAAKKNDKQKIIEEMSDLRDKMKSMIQDAAKKETSLVQLKQQNLDIKKDTNRSVYTKQIIDISSKVLKQKQEIDKVLCDTKVIQKEINSLIGKLERQFAVVENVGYKEATSSEKARPVYRAVIAVHEGCGELVDIVRETGAIQREISDLQEQLNLEKNKKVEEHLSQLLTDLDHVKKENLTLKQNISKGKS